MNKRESIGHLLLGEFFSDYPAGTYAEIITQLKDERVCQNLRDLDQLALYYEYENQNETDVAESIEELVDKIMEIMKWK